MVVVAAENLVSGIVCTNRLVEVALDLGGIQAGQRATVACDRRSTRNRRACKSIRCVHSPNCLFGFFDRDEEILRPLDQLLERCDFACGSVVWYKQSTHQSDKLGQRFPDGALRSLNLYALQELDDFGTSQPVSNQLIYRVESFCLYGPDRLILTKKIDGV